jgi:hypothetical protein
MAGRGGATVGAGRKSKDEENRIRDLMKPHSLDAINCLVAIMNGNDNRPSDRISAAKLIIEYTYGKPKETIDTTHTINDFDIKEVLGFGKSK